MGSTIGYYNCSQEEIDILMKTDVRVIEYFLDSEVNVLVIGTRRPEEGEEMRMHEDWPLFRSDALGNGAEQAVFFNPSWKKYPPSFNQIFMNESTNEKHHLKNNKS